MKTILSYICPQIMLIIAIRYFISQMDLIKKANNDIQIIGILKRTNFLIGLSLIIIIFTVVFNSFIGLGVYLIFHLILTQHPLLTDFKRLVQFSKTKVSLDNNLITTIKEKK